MAKKLNDNKMITFYRCLSQEECEGVTLENCGNPIPMMTLSAMIPFDCEKSCKLYKNCLSFKFTESNGVCELFASEFRTRCSQIAGPLV